MVIMTATTRKPGTKLKPLKITCTSADCENDLHCFRTTRKMSPFKEGRCRDCGADLIKWERIHLRDLSDAEFVFKSLKYEMFRHHFWHKPIDQLAENHARRKGRIALREAAVHRIRKSVGAAEPTFNGRQTPRSENLIYYAQHALACCCRKCMEYWHGIEMHVALTDDQIKYFTNLIMIYVDERMPDLDDNAIYVPPIRQSRS